VDTGAKIKTNRGIQEISEINRIGRETSIANEEGSGDSQEPGVIEEPERDGEVPELDSRSEESEGEVVA
jgi:hypothetical protein